MTSSVTSCSAWRLYVILDRAAAGQRDLVDLARAAIRGGADALQLRDKAASDAEVTALGVRLLEVTRPAGIPLIVNDRAVVASAIGAEGLHLGQDDLPIAEARRLVTSGTLIGKSTHSLEQALAAEREGADYLGYGPLFGTPTKPDYAPVGLGGIRDVIARTRIPVICIGGIDAATVQQVVEAGAGRIAVVRAVCASPDAEAASRTLKEALTGPLP